ncbi:hypothetical protein DR64_1918 [Paraburkholderia xenovorans LB400]|jgi:hypothetical protein|uniref:DUF4276 family protein n=1 Tax=Paraburkholderia xenovorans (strain LB400) TaxID=266265 RepID=Q146I1_PARXL|nr:DUF4276 family protein [Paraburkholderia xenovorans]ABE28758.1 Conserved hypothetical protein [Paraburkholderia xenovorans LB400]AIP29777.1 hypothetical protein DR64_1918 [Paraburkholderia xenovorans LB400]
MVELIIVGEGQTEETFVRDVLAPALGANHVYASARLISTSREQRGGALSLERVRKFIGHTLRQRADTYVTTLIDLYGLDKSFRGVMASKGQTPATRAAHIERLLHEDVVGFAECRPERFIPHVQPHEFESLLFSDVTRLCDVEPEWHEQSDPLIAARAAVDDPEWINDSPQTAPSKRLERLQPRYRKVRHGPLAAARIGLDRIREQCPHFRQWYDRIVTLPALQAQQPNIEYTS